MVTTVRRVILLVVNLWFPGKDSRGSFFRIIHFLIFDLLILDWIIS